MVTEYTGGLRTRFADPAQKAVDSHSGERAIPSPRPYAAMSWVSSPLMACLIIFYDASLLVCPSLYFPLQKSEHK